MLTALLYALLGLAVGAFGTLVGAGGGFILTPILLILLPTTPAVTISAISLAVVFFNAVSGTLAYARQRRIDYRSGITFALATLPGAVAGALLVASVSRYLFDSLMAGLLLVLGLWLLLGRSQPGGDQRATGSRRELHARDGEVYQYTVRTGQGVAYSLGVGFLSSFLGIGGGIMHVPLLVQALGFPVHVATATSHFVLANMAAVGTITHITAGSFDSGTTVALTLELSAGVVVGAQVGAILSRRVGGRAIRRLLACALIVLAARLALSVV